jgi:hypothetical protein
MKWTYAGSIRFQILQEIKMIQSVRRIRNYSSIFDAVFYHLSAIIALLWEVFAPITTINKRALKQWTPIKTQCNFRLLSEKHARLA